MANDVNTITVDSYAVMNLYDRGVYDELLQLYQESVEDPLEAAKFYKTLSRMLQIQRRELEQRAPDLLLKYEKMIQEAALVGYPYLGDEVALNIFEHKPISVIRSGFDVLEQLRIFLAGHYVLEERNKLRENLREALERSVQPFGNESTKNSDKHLDTVAKWLEYRNEILGPVTESDLIADKQFLAQDRFIKLLSPEQQEEFSKLLAIYRWLHISSLWQEGMEDRVVLRENGRLKVLRNGIIEDISPASSALSTPPLTEGDYEESVIEDIKTDVPDGPLLTKVIDNKELNQTQSSEEKLASGFKKDENLNKPAPAVKPVTNDVPFIHPVPQTFKSDKPALIFDIEDEKEVDKHRHKAGGPPVLEQVIRAFVDEIIEQKNLVFRDEVNQRRFVQLMVSRLKDVRGKLEIAEVLRKPIEAGGLGMSEDKADQVLGIIEEAKREFESRAKEKRLNIPEPVPEVIPKPAKVEAPKPSFDAEAAKQWRDQMLKEIQAQTQSVAKTEANESPPVFKPQLLDVKAPPKVIGPLEELRSLTLVDFRRLGANPQEVLQKIRGKIDLLGETSISHRLEAVRAWKSSVVYQQYLRLGRESIEQGKPISAIVASHQRLGEPCLTEDEFSAIADFNAKLRF